MFRRSIQYVTFSVVIAVPGLLFAQPPGRGGPPGGQQGGMRGGPPTEMIMELFQQADADGNGSVTRAELTTAMQSGERRGRGGPPSQQGGQARGERRGRGGQLPRGEDGVDRPRPEHGEGGHRGPPPQTGQVLPEMIAETLNLDEKQTRQLAALQADVDKRLAAILTDEQQEQLQNARPQHGPGHGEGPQGGRAAGDRPQRPERPQ
ncbi:EF-hand domain-containing protein [Adhaeretor mobilis]|uniref:EF-hand domain-containing protein n=1 Tax=Adhaeretor mobilis TaxID=1930276 RepID=A0A517MSL6_9BACT|nr:EF-hand domain-containing protein [Adhaeretor mobilis]QDS97871.1 hypothetical protein HG15A2_11390 [Adhaeretor mobilis]